MDDLVSIVMPAHNVVDFVEEAVASAHAQTWPRIELIAIDDGSQDDTGARLEQAPGWDGPGREMVLIHQTNKGMAAARNVGLARARGTYVCFLDADDRLYPDCITRMVTTLADDPDLILAAPLWRYVDMAGQPLGVISEPGALRHDAHGLVIHGPLHSDSGVVVRRKAACETEPFDTSLSGCIGLDWFVRLLNGYGKAAGIVPEPLADYRKRRGQITADWQKMEANWTRVLEKMRAEGHGLPPSDENRARARNMMFWATMAYQAGDYPATRRFVRHSWRRAPGAAAADPMARIRTLAAMASLLPAPLHDALRRRVNARD